MRRILSFVRGLSGLLASRLILVDRARGPVASPGGTFAAGGRLGHQREGHTPAPGHKIVCTKSCQYGIQRSLHRQECLASSRGALSIDRTDRVEISQPSFFETPLLFLP
jgi:hypothetical protein